MIFRHQPKEAKVLSTFSNICVIFWVGRYCRSVHIKQSFLASFNNKQKSAKSDSEKLESR
jgi:hypothetical protein